MTHSNPWHWWRRQPATIWLIWGVFVGTFGATSLNLPNNRASYASFVVLLAGFVLRRGWRTSIRWQLYDAVPLLLLGVWAYGCAIGMARGTPPVYVFTNFAGMLLYSVYFVLRFERVDRWDLLRCVLAAAIVNATYMLGFFVWDKLFTPMHRFMSIRDYYSETFALLGAPMAVLLYLIFWTPEHRRTLIARSAALYTLEFIFLQTSLSKATVLAFAIGMVVLACVAARQVFRRARAGQFGAIVAALGMLAIAYSPVTRVIGNALPPAPRPQNIAPSRVPTQSRPDASRGFSRASTGGRVTFIAQQTALPPPETWLDRLGQAMRSVNSAPQSAAGEADWNALEQGAAAVRARQTQELIADLHFWGKGLGASLSNGYSRDASGYGFEQNYLNLLHKFGVVALLIFAAYALMIWRVIAGAQSRSTRMFATASASVMIGLVMGIGNPVLMSPVLVTLQCVLLFWLRPPDRVS